MRDHVEFTTRIDRQKDFALLFYYASARLDLQLCWHTHSENANQSSSLAKKDPPIIDHYKTKTLYETLNKEIYKTNVNLN